MKEQEKAYELAEKYYDLLTTNKTNKFSVALAYNKHMYVPMVSDAKQCAVIACDLVMSKGMLLDDMQASISNHDKDQTLKYWRAVRSEIEKL